MDDVREILARHLPEREVASVIPLGEGLEHRAYEVDGELVVRFAKDEDRAVEREARLLAEVAPLSPVAVPEPLFVDRAARCIAYRKLPGVPLLDVPPDRRAGAAEPVGATLGRLLAALHAAPMPAMAGVDDAPPAEWRDEAAGLYAAVAGRLDPARRSAIETFLAAAPPARGATRVFSHNDLGIEHVLVDPATLAVRGVIDWGDAAICDPAHDLGLILRDLGPRALDAALGAYGRVEPGLGERALFYARCAALEDLAYGLESGRREYARKSLAGMAWLF